MTYIPLILGSLLLIGIYIVRQRLKEAPLFRIKECGGRHKCVLEKRHRVFHYWSSCLEQEDTGNIIIDGFYFDESIYSYGGKKDLEPYIKRFEEYWNKKQSGKPLYKYHYYGLVDVDNESEN